MVELKVERGFEGELYASTRPQARYASYLRSLIRCVACIAVLVLLSGYMLPLIEHRNTSSSRRDFPVRSDSPPFDTTRPPSFTPILPPSYPLAVRTPYLSAWLPGAGAATLPHTRPQFWTGAELTWSVIARVNGKTFNLFGVPFSDGYVAPPATVLGAHFTSTHSIFKLEAGGVNFKLDFFSPVSPKNYLRQSLPFSYLTVTASHAFDGSSPASVQIYSDIDETWTGAPQDAENTNYVYKTRKNISAYQISVKDAAVFAEHGDMAVWGRVVWAAEHAPKIPLTASVGRLSAVRGEFARDGKLNNLMGQWRHAAIRNGFVALKTVAAFAYDLGEVIEEIPVTFVIGHVRDAAINYLGEAQTPFYRGTYQNVMPALSHFFEDYEDAFQESQQMDHAIETAATEVAGKKYADILALSLRQTFGGMELTIPFKSRDTFGNDTMAWIKENSSNGDINTMDIIYPSFPLFYLLNPEWIRMLLEPHLRYLNTGRYTNPYAVHDLGRHYPNATGHDDLTEEPMPIESTGNVLILIYAYTKASGNDGFYKTYYKLLEHYADYLVENGLYPAYQRSTNDAIGQRSNQTNLGIKAAVAINAWGILTSQDKYKKIGKSYAEKIHTELGTTTKDGRTFFSVSYGEDDWFGPFNLYPDKLLGLNTFSPEALQTANNTYERREAGVPLMGSVNWGKTDWQMFCAGAATEKATRDMFIDDLHALISNGLNTAPFTDRYWCRDQAFPNRGLKFLAGGYNAFRARPTLGAHFSVLALEGLDALGDVSGVLFENEAKADLK